MTKFKLCMSSCRPVGAIMKTANRNFRELLAFAVGVLAVPTVELLDDEFCAFAT